MTGKSTSVNALSDHELRAALKDHGLSPGPITDSTRDLYRKKLVSILEDVEEEEEGTVSEEQDRDSDLEDETSDESFEVDEDELNESSDSYSEEVEEDDVEDTDMDDLKDSASQSNPSNSRYYLVLITTVAVIIASIYLYSNNIKVFKNLTRQLLLLLAISPIGYLMYRSYRFYTTRRHEENTRVCKLVSDALELLQSPENPKGLMPILHIRDTLLTPAERKAKATIMSWQKAVKFIEEHESRVKVELVNIDGEDFRAWKWIGSRKMNRV